MCVCVSVSVNPHVGLISSTDIVFSLGGCRAFQSGSAVCFSLVGELQMIRAESIHEIPFRSHRKEERQFVDACVL